MDELYEQNAQIVFLFLVRLCRDEELAQELTQETFLRAIESLGRYDGTCRISTWLCQIARHILYQHWEKEKRSFHVELDEEIPAGENTEQSAIHRIELSTVREALERLPKQTRDLVKLRAFTDLSFRDIGEMLGKSENWARVTYYRAKLQLLKEVENGET